MPRRSASHGSHDSLARILYTLTRERRVALDVIGESYLVRGLIINSFSVLVYKCTALWLGFEQMNLCKLSRCDIQHSNQIFAVLRLPSA